MNDKIDARPAVAKKITLTNGVELIVPHDYSKASIEAAIDFEFRPSDIVLASYPKSGTQWTAEITWLICNNADITSAKSVMLEDRFRQLEKSPSAGSLNQLDVLNAWPENQTRFIQTHLPMELLEKKLLCCPTVKLIYVVRNPKDTCVSFYHFHRMKMEYSNPGPWNEFVEKFVRGEVTRGSWFEHVRGYLLANEKYNFAHFVSYEDMSSNLRNEVIKLANFLNMRDLSEDQISTIVEHCTFANMKDNKCVNYQHYHEDGRYNFEVSKFMRKGIVGDWKNHFTIEQSEAFDAVYEERTKDWPLQLKFHPVA